MVTNLIIAIFLFVVSSFFVSAGEALWLAGLYLGVAFLVIGILMIVNRPFRERYYRKYMSDPEWERTHSEKEKYFFDRFYFPLKGIVGGVLMIFAYWLTHQQSFFTILNWLKELF